MRTSFHHQSEAQHPKSSAIHKYAGRLPHLMTQSGQFRVFQQGLEPRRPSAKSLTNLNSAKCASPGEGIAQLLWPHGAEDHQMGQGKIQGEASHERHKLGS